MTKSASVTKTSPKKKTALKKSVKEVRKGKPNVSLTALAGALVSKGASLEECLRLASLVNSGNVPPKEEKEVESIVRSIYEKHHGKKEAASEHTEQIDVTQFTSLSSQEVINTLGITIKKDEENKLITFFALLSAYTTESQLNVSFNAPSSTGKSYIPTEIARLFPEEDVIKMAYCSPTAFFHDIRVFDKEINGYFVDLERKILIFLDQPHPLLLEHLRPLLSHDDKEIPIKITDKTQKAGLKTKNIILKGFPAVVFCTAGLKIDEQEATRFLLLSPDTAQEKLRQAIEEKIKKEADQAAYFRFLDEQPDRKLLKDRIRAIKKESIQDIKIGCWEKVKEMFFHQKTVLKPRHQRDIGHLMSLIKIFALLNLWFREKDGSTITANEADVIEAFKIWDVIAESQDFGISPYIYDLYKEVILPAYKEKEEQPLKRQDVTKKFYEVHGRPLADWQLRQQIIPMLENVGLITQEQDSNDRRNKLIIPSPLRSGNGEPQKHVENEEETEVLPEKPSIDLRGAIEMAGRRGKYGKYK